MEENDKNEEVHAPDFKEATTKYGEYIPSLDAWTTAEEQKKISKKLEDVASSEKD